MQAKMEYAHKYDDVHMRTSYPSSQMSGVVSVESQSVRDDEQHPRRCQDSCAWPWVNMYTVSVYIATCTVPCGMWHVFIRLIRVMCVYTWKFPLPSDSVRGEYHATQTTRGPVTYHAGKFRSSLFQTPDAILKQGHIHVSVSSCINRLARAHAGVASCVQRWRWQESEIVQVVKPRGWLDEFVSVNIFLFAFSLPFSLSLSLSLYIYIYI